MSWLSGFGRGAALQDAIRKHFEERRFAEALPLARKWCALEPRRWEAHADRAVAAKHAREFAESLEASIRAIELAGRHAHDGMQWNLGIAATAVGDWERARSAWKACGYDIPGSTGPIQAELGLAPIRIARGERSEVVWCERVCPVRAVIRNIPLPQIGRRFGELVLHDGEPRGKRASGGRLYSVFDELALLERSPHRTRVLEITAPAEADVDALTDCLRDSVAGFEDWTASLEMLCRACSEGVPHEQHQEVAAEWDTARRIAIASETSPPRALLDEWERGAPGRSVVRVTEPDTGA